jgi:hypothetical protein
MGATVLADWQVFFTAQLGAAATLLGLLFVGLSLNLQKILQVSGLPNRALLALSVFLCTLMVSSYVLIPSQGETAIGWEILCTGASFFAFGMVVEVRTLRFVPSAVRPNFIGNMIFLAAALAPYVIGGIIMVTGNADGLYWVAAAVIISFIKGIADSWVLLVEINR